MIDWVPYQQQATSPPPEIALPPAYQPPKPVSTIGLLEFPTHRKIELE
jgi:hypothetical protein